MDGQTRAGGPDGASPGAGRTDGERADAYRFALDTVLDGMRANAVSYTHLRLVVRLLKLSRRAR